MKASEVCSTHAATECTFVGTGAGGGQGDMILFALSLYARSVCSVPLCVRK